MAEEIQRVAVWPPLLRLLHIMMAFLTLILMVTGWLMQSGLILNHELFLHLRDVWHLPSGNVLAAVLLIRVSLLIFGKGVLSWKALIPDNLQAVIGTATFYLSLGRMNLPGYYAHNPLWKPFYLILLLMLLLMATSGLLMESAFLRSVVRMDSARSLATHTWMAGPVAIIVIAHILTSLLHDWKSQTAEISAMISGNKFFTVDKKSSQAETDVQLVSINSLLKNSKKQQ